MLFLFSGFGSDFEENLHVFSRSVRGEKRLALLLQGGDGYEPFLDQYLAPLRAVGFTEIDIVAPPSGSMTLTENDISAIARADGIFIGVGWTGVYWEKYCTGATKQVITSQFHRDTPIAGLSAGAKLMNDRVYLDHIGEFREGFAFFKNRDIFPHFEEDGYAHKALQFCCDFPGSSALGIETNTMLTINRDGSESWFGSGHAYRIESDAAGEVAVRRIR